MTEHTWSVRVRTGAAGVRVHAAGGSFALGRPLSFDAAPPPGPPTALETLLGALGADLLGTLLASAGRRYLVLEELELSLGCRLGNPLVALGVVGEPGDPGLAAVWGTVYASHRGPPDALDEAWAEALAQSPLVATLSRATALSLRLVTV